MHLNIYIYIYIVGLDSSVDIATRYGLEGPGVEFRCWRDFSNRSPVAQPASCTMGIDFLSRWLKRPGRGVGHSPPYNTEIKERVELYSYSPSGPSCPVVG